MKIEISKLTAEVLQRILHEEVKKQIHLQYEAQHDGLKDQARTHKQIVKELNELREDIELKGVDRYYNFEEYHIV